MWRVGNTYQRPRVERGDALLATRKVVRSVIGNEKWLTSRVGRSTGYGCTVYRDGWTNSHQLR